MAMNLTCPACNAAVQTTDAFCGTCGYRLQGAPPSIVKGPPAQVAKTPQTQKAPILQYGMSGGSSSGNTHLLQPGDLIAGRYRLEARVTSRGAMGEVWRAHDERLAQRLCAVKRVAVGGGTPEEHAERVEWLKREADTMARLQHPTICAIHDMQEDGGEWYLILEWIEGQTLTEELRAHGAPGLPPERVLDWAKTLGEALSYLHGQQPPLIFRDLKPDNIMLRQDGTIKLIDLGITRPMVSAGGTVIGTVGYAPPEQYAGTADARSDEYALAATLHHLLTGRDPQKFNPAKETIFDFPALQALIPGLDPHLNTVLQHALSRDPQQRYPTMAEFTAALLAVKTKSRGRLGMVSRYPRRVQRSQSQTQMTVAAGQNRWPRAALGASGVGVLACLLPWVQDTADPAVPLSMPSWTYGTYSYWLANLSNMQQYNWQGVLPLLMLVLGGLCAYRSSRAATTVQAQIARRGTVVFGALALLGVGIFFQHTFIALGAFGLAPALGFWLAALCALLLTVTGIAALRISPPAGTHVVATP